MCVINYPYVCNHGIERRKRQRARRERFNYQSPQRLVLACTNQQPPQRGGAVPDTPGAPLHFFAMLPPERPQKGSSQLLQNRSPVLSFSFLLPFFVSSFFLMSGNVHPNPGFIFPCSVCAENETWRGKSVQCCTCSKWVHLRCL